MLRHYQIGGALGLWKENVILLVVSISMGGISIPTFLFRNIQINKKKQCRLPALRNPKEMTE